MTTALSGNDTLVINGRPITDFGDADNFNLTFPNEIANVKTGKNGNAIFGQNATGRQCEITARIIRGSKDDKFLNNLLSQQNYDFASFVLMTGEAVKKMGQGDGTINNDTYILSGGIFSKNVEGKSNQEGDTEQSIAMYTMKFSAAPRVIT